MDGPVISEERFARIETGVTDCKVSIARVETLLLDQQTRRAEIQVLRAEVDELKRSEATRRKRMAVIWAATITTAIAATFNRWF